MPDNDLLEQQLTEAFIRFGQIFTKTSIIVDGVIDSVDIDTFTCDINVKGKNPDGSEKNTMFYDVSLKVLKGSQASFVEIPKVGTACTMTFKDNNIQRPELFQVQQCDQILIKVDDQTLKISIDGFVFNNAEHGAVKADVLKTESEKDKTILDALLQIINGAPIPEPGNMANSAFQLALQGVLAGKQTGIWTELENEKIKM